MKKIYFSLIVLLTITFLFALSLPGYSETRKGLKGQPIKKAPTKVQRTKPVEIEVKSASPNNLRLEPGGKEVIVTLRGSNLNKVTSAKVLMNNRPVREVGIRLGSPSAKSIKVTLKAKSKAKPGSNYKLRLIAGKETIDVSTRLLRLEVTAPKVVKKIPVKTAITKTTPKTAPPPMQQIPGVGTSPGIGPPLGISEQCPDPAADRIEVKLLSRVGLKGRVRITGFIKNLGSRWRPSVAGQRLRMQLRIGALSPQTTSTVKHLRGFFAGTEIIISHDMDWNTATPSSANKRFRLSVSEVIIPPVRNPSDYTVDCKSDNNSKEITGAVINALFPPTPDVATIDPDPPTPDKDKVAIDLYTLRVLKNELHGNGKLSVTLAYKKGRRMSTKITASVAPPHAGEASSAIIDRTPQHINGQADMTVQVECNSDPESASTVTIKYELRTRRVPLPGGGSIPGWRLATASQTLPYAGAAGVCGPGLRKTLPLMGSTTP